MEVEKYPPAIDPDYERSFRRGYHQAVKELAQIIARDVRTHEQLASWIDGPGMAWKDDTSFEVVIPPPEIYRRR